jgi:hypothetical protein
MLINPEHGVNKNSLRWCMVHKKKNVFHIEGING